MRPTLCESLDESALILWPCYWTKVEGELELVKKTALEVDIFRSVSLGYLLWINLIVCVGVQPQYRQWRRNYGPTQRHMRGSLRDRALPCWARLWRLCARQWRVTGTRFSASVNGVDWWIFLFLCVVKQDAGLIAPPRATIWPRWSFWWSTERASLLPRSATKKRRPKSARKTRKASTEARNISTVNTSYSPRDVDLFNCCVMLVY